MLRHCLIASVLLVLMPFGASAQTYPLNYKPNLPATASQAPGQVPAPILAPAQPDVALPEPRSGSVLPPTADDVLTMGTPLPGQVDPSLPSSRDAVVQRPAEESPPAISSGRSLVGARLVGRPKVIDGNTLVLQGQVVVLNGADAPELKQTCNDLTGMAWRCGERSAKHLDQLVGDVSIICIGLEDIPGAVAATCRAGNTDFGKAMVRDGMAVVPYWMSVYRAEQLEARSDMRGVWAGSFVMPWKFRSDL